MQKFYVDDTGKLLGSYDGPDDASPYPGARVATTLPQHPLQRWDGSAWVYSKPALKQLAKEKRVRIEQGGIVVSGMPIATDRESQAMISGAGKLFDEDPTLNQVDWAVSSEVFVTLTKAQVKQTGVVVGRHVQRCFSRQKEIAALIDAGTITTPEQIEAWEGWSL